MNGHVVIYVIGGVIVGAQMPVWLTWLRITLCA